MNKETRRGLGWLRKIVAMAPVVLLAGFAYGAEMFMAAMRGNSWG